MTDNLTPDSPTTETCTFTPDELGAPIVWELMDNEDLWDPGCSRPVWDGTDSGLCVWHAKHSDKPTEELAATVRDGKLVGARARECDLTSVSFPEGSILIGADLTDADLLGADLTGTDLYMADLTDADLENATLTDANLIGAILTKANLLFADLTNANLSP